MMRRADDCQQDRSNPSGAGTAVSRHGSRHWWLAGTRTVLRTTLLVAAFLSFGTTAGFGAPGDLVLERSSESDELPVAVFPHWIHRARYRCYVCHPALFAMKKGATEMTKAAMRKGESCGRCHNGRAAFEIGLPTCSRCHRALKK